MRIFVLGLLVSLLLVFLDVKLVQWIIGLLPDLGKWQKAVTAGIWIADIWALWVVMALPSIIGWFYWYERKNGHAYKFGYK